MKSQSDQCLITTRGPLMRVFEYTATIADVPRAIVWLLSHNARTLSSGTCSYRPYLCLQSAAHMDWHGRNTSSFASDIDRLSFQPKTNTVIHCHQHFVRFTSSKTTVFADHLTELNRRRTGSSETPRPHATGLAEEGILTPPFRQT